MEGMSEDILRRARALHDTIFGAPSLSTKRPGENYSQQVVLFISFVLFFRLELGVAIEGQWLEEARELGFA